MKILCDIDTDNVLHCPIKDFVLVQLNNTFMLEENVPESDNTPYQTLFGFVKIIGVILFLLAFAALASGLSFALFSINPVSLQILKNSRDAKDRNKAEKILKLTKNPHLLFISLTLWDAAATETLPYFMGELTASFLAIMVSVILVVMITDILPQILFKKHTIEWSYYFYYPVLILKIIAFPIAFPLTKLLGFFVSDDDTSFYKRNELVTLLEIHSDIESGGADGIPPLMDREAELLKRCLKPKTKTIKEFQKSLNSFLYVPIESPISDGMMRKILIKGTKIVLLAEKNKVISYVTTEKLLKHSQNNDVIYPNSLEPKTMEMMIDSTTCFDALDHMQKNDIQIVLVCDSKHEITGLIDTDILSDIVAPCLIEDFRKLFLKYDYKI